MSNNNKKDYISNLIDDEKFIKTVSTLHSLLEDRKEILQVFENRKTDIEGYQRYLQDRVNYDIRKDFLRPIKVNEKGVLRYITRLCEDYTSLLQYYLEEEDESEDENEEEEEEEEDESEDEE